MSRPDRLPRVAAVLVAAALLHLLGVAALAFAHAPFLARLVRSASIPRILGVVVPIVDVSIALFAVVVCVLTVRVPRGVPGRARVALLSVAATIHFTSWAATVHLAMRSVRRAIDTGLAGALAPVDLFLGIDPGLSRALQIAGGIAAAAALAMLLGLVLCWFLLRERLRARLFLAIDAALLVGCIATTILFPIRPGGAEASLVGPSIRLALTAALFLRGGLRGLPAFFDAIEKVNVRWMLASRHLRAKKSNFLAAISGLSILAVALSSCMLTTVLSVMGGFRDDLKQKILGHSAHVVVDRDHGSFEGWGETLRIVRATPSITAATPYADGEVMVTSSSNLSGAVLRGIDPATISAVTDLRRNLVQGTLDGLEHPERLLDDDRRAAIRRPGDASRDVLPGIIIGRELARTLRLYVGDELDVIAPYGELGPTGPIPKTRSFRIAGIFFSGMYEYDMKLAYVLLPVAQRFLGLGDAISGIEARVRDVDRAPEVARSLASRIGRRELRIEDWQAKNKNLFGALALEKLAMFVTLGIAVVIAGFCVFGTLTLMVQEKTKEVGILKAMGATDRAIVAVFLFEGFLIGLFGATLGLALGFVVAFAAEHFGIGINPEFYYIDRLPVHVDATEFALVGASAIVVCLLSTVFPALLASGTRPVDALRYE